MQEELKRCNYIGNQQSMYDLANIAISDTPIEQKSIISICDLNPNMKVKIRPCLLLYVELGLLIFENNKYLGTESGISSINSDISHFVETLSRRTISYLIDQELIRANAVTFDYDDSICLVKRSGFPLSAAVFRNLLLETNAIQETNNGFYRISSKYEDLFESKFRAQNSKLSLKQLIEIHRRQEVQGRLAEEFVVEFEKRRLMWSENSSKVKQISDLDVSAGYDIVSYNTSESAHYDRFIEVKSFVSSQSFYWSSNEMRVAREKGDSYYLYIVDMSQYQLVGYEPIIVQNPYEQIIKTDDWITETESIKVTRI